METKTCFKIQAIALRKQGFSYNEIRQKIPVAKSTLSLWLKTIKLKKEYRDKLYSRQIEILARGVHSQKERREKQIKEIIVRAKQEISYPLSHQAYQLFGTALYWAEGSKTKDCAVTNSDPNLILFMIKWFEDVFGIQPCSLKVSLNIYNQQSERNIKRFWSELCGIPLENFGKSFIKPINKGFKKNNLYYGTIKIRIPKGTDLRWRIFAWTQKALESVKLEVSEVERRWENLKKIRRPVNLR